MSNSSAMETGIPKRYCGSTAMTVVMTLATAATALCMFKFPPIMTHLMEYYDVQTDLMGLLMSSSNLIGLVFGVAIGYANRNLLPKWSGLLGFLIMAAANVLAMNTSSFIVLIISRMIEGTGLGFISNLTISLVVSYTTTKRTTATAIVNAGMSIGEIVHQNLAPRIIAATGNLDGMYMYIIGTFVVMAIVMFVFLRREPSIASCSPKVVTVDKAVTKAKRAAVLKNRSLLLIAIAMFVFNITISFGSYVNAYMEEVKGFDAVAAGTLNSLGSFIRFFVMIGFGVLADRIHSNRKPAIASFIGLSVCYLLLVLLPGNLLFIYVILSAIAPAAITNSTYSCYPDIFGDASLTPVAHSVVQTFARLSMLLGATIVGFMIKYMGYTASIMTMVPLILFGAVCWYFAKQAK